MTIQTYDSFDLIGVVNSLENEPITFLRDRFFGTVQTFQTEEVHFDMLDKVRRLAPFVSPLVKGKVVESRGYTTKYFRPAYVKPKTAIRPTDALKRRAGEAIGGSMTPEQRRAAHIVQALAEHIEMIDMREEVMAAEILRTGKVTISGEGFGTVVMDFGRAAGLTITLAGGDLWSAVAAGVPMTNLKTWLKAVRTSSNAIVRDFVMDPDAWDVFLSKLSDSDKELLFDSLRGSQSRVELGPRLAEKVRYEGNIGEIGFWTYSDTYTDEDGNEQELMPSGTVIAASTALEGVRAYGAILDVNSLRAERVFPKIWPEEDPSLEWLMTQSAPMLAPLRPNASLGASVLA